MSRRGGFGSSVRVARCAHCRPVVTSSTWAPPDVIPTVPVTSRRCSDRPSSASNGAPSNAPLRRSSLTAPPLTNGSAEIDLCRTTSARGCTPTEQATRESILTGSSKPAQSAHSLARPFQHPPLEGTAINGQVGGYPTGPDTVPTGRDEQAGIGRLHPSTRGSHSQVRDITIRCSGRPTRFGTILEFRCSAA